MNPFLLTNVVFNDTPFQFYTHKDDFIIGGCLRQGIVFQEKELKFLKSLVMPGSKVLDAGANIGVMSIPLAKLEPSATIYCFEPDPLNFALLNLNIVINGITNIHAFNYALGKEHKFVTFYKNSTNYGDHRTSIPLYGDVDSGYFNSLPIHVQMVNIVDFLKQCLGDQAPNYFDVLKIDTQGADIDILDSCIPLINGHSTVLMEYCPYLLLRNGTTKEQISRILDYFTTIGISNLNQQGEVTFEDKGKIMADFDILSPKIAFYDISLQGKK
ncbi:FkbM family methyltransferase [Peribacillus simplex]|uniref:FkbM family methyltransferase n=1 Tax=Peribacillus simplex TaxID=1478 RepID=UPI00203DD3D8|nr:FkbM family methyltransferase [Peribacillus simplex]MCM3673267.1 FkbM family methyltransferase [Peribacillus simplex]